ncbi:MAG: hypothetical protein M1155_02220 [Patescibacteria group bacterium]|nr:hypothetical protein [Patescibacteria group bacterium]
MATSKQMFSLINKINFILSSRRDSEVVVYPHRAGATQKLNKIYLPEGKPDFNQSIRYVASKYMHTFSSTSLGLGQNQGFNLMKIFI